MGMLYTVPSWFLHYGAFLQLTFALVSLLVAIYAFKIYKISEEKKIKMFSFGFLLISLSYILWPIINFIAAFPIGGNILAVFMENNEPDQAIAVYSYILLFLIGLVTLAYSAFEKKDLGVYALLVALVGAGVVINPRQFNMIYIIASVLTFFIFSHYLWSYFKEGRKKTGDITTAFGLLFLGCAGIVLSYIHDLFYVGGHLFMLGAYIIILTKLASNYRKGKKKPGQAGKHLFMIPTHMPLLAKIALNNKKGKKV